MTKVDSLDRHIVFNTLPSLSREARVSLMSTATGTHGRNVVYYNSKEPHLVALTIDDAPSRSAPEFKQLLDVLKECDVRVTFQVISDHVSSDEHWALMERALRDGHQLTNHSTKDEKCAGLSESEFRSRLAKCQTLLDKLDPRGRRWFRPPSGEMNAMMREILLAEGYTVCMGDCFSGDPSVGPDVDYHCKALLKMAMPGSVLILHCPESPETLPNEGWVVNRHDRRQTLEIIPKLVCELREQGLQFATLDELFPASSFGDQLCEVSYKWMWADAGTSLLGHGVAWLNPWRWSAATSASDMLAELERNVADQDGRERPVRLQVVEKNKGAVIFEGTADNISQITSLTQNWHLR